MPGGNTACNCHPVNIILISIDLITITKVCLDLYTQSVKVFATMSTVIRTVAESVGIFQIVQQFVLLTVMRKNRLQIQILPWIFFHIKEINSKVILD